MKEGRKVERKETRVLIIEERQGNDPWKISIWGGSGRKQITRIERKEQVRNEGFLSEF